MTRFGAIFRLEFRALLARRMTVAGSALSVLAGAAAATLALSDDPNRLSQAINGWRCLALGMGAGLTVAALVAVLLGSQMVAAAAGEGSLRSSLCRPISRTAFIGAQAAALAVVAVLLTLAVIAGALLVGAFAGYGPVVVELAGGVYPKESAGTMARRALLLCAGAPLGVVAAGWLGLVVSSLMDHAGSAAGAALLIAAPVAWLSHPQNPWGHWSFLWPGLKVWDAFRHLGEGESTLAWDDAPLQAALAWPLLTMAVAAVAMWWCFTRRDVLD